MPVWPFSVTLLIVWKLGVCEDSQELQERLKLEQEYVNEKFPRDPVTHTTPEWSSWEHHVAHISGVGVDRGPRFYEFASQSPEDDADFADFQSSISDSETYSKEKTDEASSVETKEQKRRNRAWRECVPCALDMVRKHTNIGISWICAAYQRARRTFKSECLMHYRNCQDGTMFVKVSEQRCPDDRFHGKHWFYQYNV